MTIEIPEAIRKQYEEFKIVRRALREESDRGCALFAAAYLDTALEALLKASFVEGRKAEGELFEGTAPLSSFSAKIKLAYFLGIISDQCRRDLDTIRKIRNDFAHDATIISFETRSIADRCHNLGFSCHEPEGPPRGHFTAAASGILGKLHALTVKAERPPIKPDDRPSEEEKEAGRKQAIEALAVELAKCGFNGKGS
ncbi:MAG: MltR family transcriptional regulator [Desulfuromonadaceae bacterium]|nr:MltR family transcriptional regulator [Desulfuromonadaceae bacterium]